MGKRSSLSLLGIETHKLRNPYLGYASWLDAYVGSVLAWLRPMLQQALGAELYDPFVLELREGINNHKSDLTHDYVVHLVHARKHFHENFLDSYFKIDL